ncbi:hypothetical protein GCM10027436_38030 [Actinophytocola sediminis]
MLLFAVVVTAVANLVGLTGFSAPIEQGTRVTATVMANAPCDDSGAGERVQFRQAGKDREARFDGCGHAEGELVEITVPPGEAGANTEVRAAQAAVGDGAPTAGVSTLLLLTACGAGAGYVCLLRRAPGQPTSAAGDSQVLH